ncbi:MAG: DUF389 domain-containing protein [Planctomycetales bacterium]|nr:DUF389 domain-containing protein [Planctomycetales bacterium]
MSIAIVIPDNWEPARLVRWSTTIARARGEDLLIIRPRRLEGAVGRKRAKAELPPDRCPLAAALQEEAGDLEVIDVDQPADAQASRQDGSRDGGSQRYVFLKRLNYAQLVEGVLREIKARRVTLLIVPRHRGVRHSEEDVAIERQLFREVPCEILLLRPGKSDSENVESILVATSGSKRAQPALHFGATVAGAQHSQLTALYVEDGSPATAPTVLPKNVDRSIRKSLKDKADTVARETVMDRDVPRGVRSYAAAKAPDVVVIGAGGHPPEAGRGPASVPEQLLSAMEEPTVVVVRHAMPLADRVLRVVEQRKKSFVPQLDREGRRDLVARLSSSANWDFDFMFLICLATLLATLGLIVDSPPVVIGAMLVAPLMTPMLGLGLSVVQGNRRLGRTCICTIARGFATALLTASAIGMLRVVSSTAVTQEMSNRGAPGLLDLGVAFISGVVAAYAFGRPHLLSVIPGIAIATSLVPPVATAGLALVSWNWSVGVGATVLFLSNFVAIVLGSAASLWVVGMRGPREICPVTAWERRWVVGFLAASACLALFLAMRSDDAQLHASPVAAAEETAGHLRRPAEVDAARPLPAETPPAPSTPTTASAADRPQAQRSGEEEGQIRVVLKPPAGDEEGAAAPAVTIIIPAGRPVANARSPRGEGTASDSQARRRRPLLRVLREAGDLFRPRQRSGDR